MSVLTWIAIYFTTWWTVLFAVLPWGATQPQEVEPGMVTGAPARPLLVKKFIWTSIIAALLVGTAWVLFNSGILDWRDIMGLNDSPW